MTEREDISQALQYAAWDEQARHRADVKVLIDMDLSPRWLAVFHAAGLARITGPAKAPLRMQGPRCRRINTPFGSASKA